MIFYIIAFVLVLYSFFDFKKSFFLYLGFKLFLNQNVSLVSLPGIPTLTLDLVLTWFYFILLVTLKKDYQKSTDSFPLKNPMIMLLVSYFFSALFGISPFLAEIANYVKFIADSIIIIWMIWQVVESEDDFSFIMNYFVWLFAFSILYAFYEYIISANPLISYEQTLNYDTSKVVDNLYSADGIRGYRVQSIFYHAIGAGMNWALFFFWLVSYQIKKMSQFSFFKIIVAIGCVICCFMTKSRSSYIFLAIISLGLIDFKSKRFYKFLPVLFLGICIILPFVSQYQDLLKTMVSVDAINSYNAGSSIDMRMKQFSAAMNLLIQRPLFGYGLKFLDYLSNSDTVQLLGLESVWLNALTKLGMLGVLSYLVQLIYDVVIIPKKYSLIWLVFLSAAYWITYTVSSVPGFSIYLFYLIMFYYIKTSKVYQNKKASSRVNQLFFKEGKIIYRRKI